MKNKSYLAVAISCFLLVIFICFFWSQECHGQEPLKWRWADDSFLEDNGKIMDDKLYHFECLWKVNFGAYLLGATRKQRMLTWIIGSTITFT